MTGSGQRLRAWLRQRRHHREFRIHAPAHTVEYAALLERLSATLAAAVAANPESAPAESTPSSPTAGHLDDRALVDAATSLWRAQFHANRGDRSWEARQTGHHLRTSRDALIEAGLVIQEHDGVRFHPGLSLEVVAYQDDPSASVEVVLETVRPTIYLHDRRIQMGQVIVARPTTDQ